MDDAPLELPPRPQPAPRAPLPVLGLVAPVVLAVVLYAVTGSPLSLLFALLGPLLALTGVLDGRIAGRRRLRRDRVAHAAALDALEAAVDARTAAERLALEAEHPSPATLAADPGRWRTRPPRGGLAIGTATLVGDRRVRGSASDDRERRIAEGSRRVSDAPFVLPAGVSVAVRGPSPLAASFARAVGVARARAEGVPVAAEVIDDEHGAPHDVVVRIWTAGRATVVHAAGAAAALEGRSFRPAYVTAAGFAPVAGGVRAAPSLTELLAAADPGPGPLAAAFAVDTAGTPVSVDLADDGPHAVVAGTTGSGKSALLAAWLLALAAAHPPDELALLLVDCKGGAAFDPLAPLPHVAGVVTDLEPDEADRAMEGLAAELARRERLLREAGVADARLAALPRLVVVVDEYRALVERAPRLAAVFADVAARGRSLAVHLVLCTQRATGTVRDELLANCGLRIGLRMRDTADSTALLGRPDAARLPAGDVGAAVLALDGRVTRVRVAHTTPEVVATEVARIAADWSGRRCAVPWHPPLPALLPVAALPAAPGVVLGLLDRPEVQSQPPLVWTPRTHPSLAVIGAPGSGRTNALELAAAALRVPILAADAAAFWDALHDGEALVADDVERLLDDLGPLHAASALERLAVRLRGRDAPTVLAFRGPGAWSGLPVRAAVGLFEERLLLGLDTDDHLALGGTRALAAARPRPGRGEWRGIRAQVALASTRADRRAAAVEALVATTEPLLLVSSAPAARRQQLVRAGLPVAERPGEDGVWVASPAGWQAEWAVCSRLQVRTPVLLDRLSPGEVRAAGVPGTLPPVVHGDDVVLVPPGGAPRRVRLPG